MRLEQLPAQTVLEVGYSYEVPNDTLNCVYYVCVCVHACVFSLNA